MPVLLKDVDRDFTIGTDGQVRIVEEINVIKNLLKNYLTSNSYERLFNRDGLDLENYVFNLEDFSEIANKIEEHIKTYPNVQDATVGFNKTENQVFINVSITVEGQPSPFTFLLSR